MKIKLPNIRRWARSLGRRGGPLPDCAPGPETELDRLTAELKTKSDAELLAILAEPWDRTAMVIILNMEVRMRLHECQHHGRDNEEVVCELLKESNAKLRDMFKMLAGS